MFLSNYLSLYTVIEYFRIERQSALVEKDKERGADPRNLIASRAGQRRLDRMSSAAFSLGSIGTHKM